MTVRHFKLHASAAETATGNSGAIETTGKDIAIAVDVTAASGTTPTLDLTVEWSPDGTNWVDADTPDAFTQLITTGGQAKEITAKARYYRLLWTIGGSTPSFTFVASGTHF